MLQFDLFLCDCLLTLVPGQGWDQVQGRDQGKGQGQGKDTVWILLVWLPSKSYPGQSQGKGQDQSQA